MFVRRHWAFNYAGYQVRIFYPNDPGDAERDNPAEWLIFDRISGAQVASGWGSTAKHARGTVAEKLVELRTGSAPASESGLNNLQHTKLPGRVVGFCALELQGSIGTMR